MYGGEHEGHARSNSHKHAHGRRAVQGVGLPPVSLIVDSVCAKVGDTVILPPTSAQLEGGESLAVVGPSGSGKTTFLDCVSGWRSATSGRVVVDGTDVTALPGRQRARFRRTKVGVIFQEAHLLRELTVAENVGIVARFRGDRDALSQVATVLAEVGLDDRAGDSVMTLSGGEAQRVAVARAVVSAVGVLVADEPTASLDRANAETVASMLIRACELRNIPLVLATHDLAVAARCSRFVDLAAT
ncbi:ABC transporter ATP-binding protein [Calidifontibacter indicus]|uniref:ABC transporter ATP-binding protein n=1 Tax=Calidifontibacter indicus TaxID=419650 RepID=UPI003D74A0C4